ncbi:MAG: IS982 family transposase [Tannerellaceae bacterium]|nr:IS982 family transposase [Tannerellaceae bacterium]
MYCIADDFCREFSKEIKKRQMPPNDDKRHRNRSFTMSDAEIITIVICFHCGSFRNLKSFYLFYIGKHLQSEFPNLLSYNRFVEPERKVMIPFALFLKLICFGECTGITFIDSTKMAVCKNKRIKRNRVFKDMATTGKSTTGWFYGFKLHLVVNDKGEPLSFCITPASVDDRQWSVIQPLCKKLSGKLYGDKGYIPASLCELLFEDGLHLVTGIKSNMKNRLMTIRDKILLRKRSVIETINDELKNICEIEHSRRRSPVNFLINLFAGLAAYSFFEKNPL